MIHGRCDPPSKLRNGFLTLITLIYFVASTFGGFASRLNRKILDERSTILLIALLIALLLLDDPPVTPNNRAFFNKLLVSNRNNVRCNRCELRCKSPLSGTNESPSSNIGKPSQVMAKLNNIKMEQIIEAEAMNLFACFCLSISNKSIQPIIS
ncbi:hypothetical protein DERP_001486 [Dermatophagoides pteronyssinus]|uniref:Uncharacterized protein n=1 Tax=Dermatophagoides pteronyssinus TaxID=6956 RepID=A0ABQ8JF89_DERPT|nr:hypothetical protein DERP_001486 [Dermatophagoides pteronyssinus]